MIVIAPTRAACETIEIAIGLHIDTVIEREHGDELRALASSRRGFGIVAGTGTGKTLAIRTIAESLLGTTALRTGVVNREREATPETPFWNVIVVTTGIARRWFQDGDILPNDTLVVDEIHQTSAELELCLALGKRVGCRFIWLSATVDPAFYARYLESFAVIRSLAFDPARAADVRCVNETPERFLSDRFLQQVAKQRRGVGMFLPTRAGVEKVVENVRDRAPRLEAAFYHGGEPIRTIRPFLEEGVPKPFFLAMTAAGQSALNVKGLDTVVIDDTRFANVVERGKNVLTRMHLGANEILQMAGRVHGRVEHGKVFILTDRTLDFAALTPTAPEFQLAGDAERVALTCAALGVRADDLDLPVPLDRQAYRQAVVRLEERGLVDQGRLTRYGSIVEALPAEREWAELIAHGEDALLPFLAVMASVESLHRMTRDERNLEGLIVGGSDHLTSYNVYADAYARAGYVGEVYGLPRHLFAEARIERWAERRGVLVKAIEDAALAMASIYRSVGVALPASMPRVSDEIDRGFRNLVARIMPFDLAIDETTADGDEARVSKTSVCGSWGAIAGTVRYFADRFGIPRASIEGTQIPAAMLRQHAHTGDGVLHFDNKRKRDMLLLQRRLTYHGFELDREEETVDQFPTDLAKAARRMLAEALAREEARHPAVRRNRPDVETIRELYRRSGGGTRRLGFAELAELYERSMSEVQSMHEYSAAALRLPLDGWIDAAERDRLMALPSRVHVRGKTVSIEYDVESEALESGERLTGVARFVLPEKLARTLTEIELPVLDRPLRFVVHRGQRGAVHAKSLGELQEILERPWMPAEVAAQRAAREESRTAHQRQRRAIDERRIVGEFRRAGSGGRGGERRGTGRDRRRRG
ncbi:MAG: hypothetical protein MNPFHGCM_02382 [Gemmatimonadaceae bacterium]|nr:hypothetical protein [Gemmatimonadaceae bacterium]